MYLKAIDDHTPRLSENIDCMCGAKLRNFERVMLRAFNAALILVVVIVLAYAT